MCFKSIMVLIFIGVDYRKVKCLIERVCVVRKSKSVMQLIIILFIQNHINNKDTEARE